MPPVISVIGKSDSGKTTVIEKLIPVLKKEGTESVSSSTLHMVLRPTSGARTAGVTNRQARIRLWSLPQAELG